MLVRFGGETVLTEVIDNKLKSAGRQFELTDRLAQELGVNGTQEIDWRFARTQQLRLPCSTLCVTPGFNVNQLSRQGSVCPAEALPDAGSAPTWLARFAPARGLIGRVEHFPRVTGRGACGRRSRPPAPLVLRADDIALG